MNDTFSSLSARAIALRVLPAVIAVLMLLLGPPEAMRSKQRTAQGNASAPSAGATKALP